VISREDLQAMFDNIANETEWNLAGDMLWGYFFTDQDQERLESCASVLVEQGYRLVDIHPTDVEEDGVAQEPTIILHVEKVETHTVESLDARNQEFYQLAESLGLESYDGMDVGPAPP
jgi:hypothetical protein